MLPLILRSMFVQLFLQVSNHSHFFFLEPISEGFINISSIQSIHPHPVFVSNLSCSSLCSSARLSLSPSKVPHPLTLALPLLSFRGLTHYCISPILLFFFMTYSLSCHHTHAPTHAHPHTHTHTRTPTHAQTNT